MCFNRAKTEKTKVFIVCRDIKIYEIYENKVTKWNS